MEDQTTGHELIAPRLLPFEVGNICWKRTRRVPMARSAILAVYFKWVEAAPVALQAVSLQRSFELACEQGLTFYDASYLSLAADRGADLISLDGDLLRAARQLGLHAPAPRG